MEVLMVSGVVEESIKRRRRSICLQKSPFNTSLQDTITTAHFANEFVGEIRNFKRACNSVTCVETKVCERYNETQL